MVLGQYMTILAGTWWSWVGTAWYQVVEGQYGAFMPVNIEKVEWRFGQVLPMFTDRHTTEYMVSQLVLSLKLQLRNANLLVKKKYCSKGSGKFAFVGRILFEQHLKFVGASLIETFWTTENRSSASEQQN